MAKQTLTELQKVEKAMNKLRNKLKRADLDYTVQVSITSIAPTEIVYAAQMTALANGLRPATFISHESIDDLVSQIKGFTETLDQVVLEKAYHEGQIIAARNTILGHEDAIKELENPTEDGEAEEQEAEAEPTPEPEENKEA